MEPRPSIEQLEQVINSTPLTRYKKGTDGYTNRRWIAEPNRFGHMKYDRERGEPDPDNPGEFLYNLDPDFVSDYERRIVEEAQMRRNLMEDALKLLGIEVVDLFVEYTRPKSPNKILELAAQAIAAWKKKSGK